MGHPKQVSPRPFIHFMDEAADKQDCLTESKMRKGSSRSQKKSKSFEPSRDDVSEAMKDFLEKGGKITKIEEYVEEEMDRILSQFSGET